MVGVPWVIHVNLSRPAPISTTFGSMTSKLSGDPLNWVKTALPTSIPLTKYSRLVPKALGPTHASSCQMISSGFTLNTSVRSL